MLTDFYIAFAPACFSLLGLWFVVIQINATGWLTAQPHRRWACAVALYFVSPGAMSLLALVDTRSTQVWRIAFLLISLAGLAGAIAFGPVRHGRSQPPPGGQADGQPGERSHTAVEWFDHGVHLLAIATYLAILVLALPSVHLLPVEGVLLTLLVLVGVYVAMRLMFLVGPPPDTGTTGGQAGPGAATAAG
jgi:hypothetical protein